MRHATPHRASRVTIIPAAASTGATQNDHLDTSPRNCAPAGAAALLMANPLQLVAQAQNSAHWNHKREEEADSHQVRVSAQPPVGEVSEETSRQPVGWDQRPHSDDAEIVPRNELDLTTRAWRLS